MGKGDGKEGRVEDRRAREDEGKREIKKTKASILTCVGMNRT